MRKRYYLAGPYNEQERLRISRDEITKLSGWTCTSRWVAGSHDNVSAIVAATNDYADIEDAEAMVIDCHRSSTRGGMWVEFGVAFERRMPIIVIGGADYAQRLNVFALSGRAHIVVVPYHARYAAKVLRAISEDVFNRDPKRNVHNPLEIPSFLHDPRLKIFN